MADALPGIGHPADEPVRIFRVNRPGKGFRAAASTGALPNAGSETINSEAKLVNANSRKACKLNLGPEREREREREREGGREGGREREREGEGGIPPMTSTPDGSM